MSQDARMNLAILLTSAVYLAAAAGSVWWIDRMLPLWLQYAAYPFVLLGGPTAWWFTFSFIARKFGVR